MTRLCLKMHQIASPAEHIHFKKFSAGHAPPPPPTHGLRGTRVTQWWEHSPPVNVLGGIFGLSLHGSRPSSEKFFSRYSGFPLSSKTNISKISVPSGKHVYVLTSSCELLGATWLNRFTTYHFTAIQCCRYVNRSHYLFFWQPDCLSHLVVCLASD